MKKDKIKIIHMVEDLKVGGLERLIETIVHGLDKNRYEVEVWCVSRGGQIADRLTLDGYSVKILGILTYYNLFNVIKLAKLLRRERPDIVHTHGYFASVIGRTSAKLAGVKLIVNHVHSTYFSLSRRNLIIEKLLSFITDKIVCCSRAVENFVRTIEQIKPEKTTVIYNGVEEDLFNNQAEVSGINRSLGVKTNDMVVGCVASLTPHKGHCFLIEAASFVLKTHPNTTFLIVGDGPLRLRLQEQSCLLGIEKKIIFTGIHEDIPALMSMMDIFVLPSSEREGLGIAVIEAMASSKPVVATNIGGIPEVVIDGKIGILVNPKDSNALVRAITSLLDAPDKAAAMGLEGQKIFRQKFTSKIMLDKMDLLYRDLIKRRVLT